MGTVRKTIQNLKPGKDYLLAVRSVNTDLGVASDPTDFIRFTVPQDDTIPSIPEGLSLVASFLNVMFVFNNVIDLDISHYEYELYKIAQITEVNQEYQILSGELPYRSGINSANVFVVSVDENSTTSSTSSVDSPVAFYGRVRSVDTSGNISDWTQIVKSGDTPLIDEEFIGSLTAAKITAGTISSAEITLSGSNSVIQSSTYKDNLGQNGWYINGNGQFSLGGPDGINYNGSAITIGSDVQVTANFSADSITVGTGLSSTLEINDAINNGGGGMTLGNPLYNYWYANGNFRVGSSTRYMYWDGADLEIRGVLKFSDGTTPGTFDNGDALTSGTIGGVTIAASKIYSGTGSYANANTAFYLDSSGNFSLKDKLYWDGTTLTVTGNISMNANNYWNTNGTFKVGSSTKYMLWNSSTSTLSLVGGNISLNTNNYWNSNGTFKVGNADKYMKWDGTNLEITGKILGGTSMEGNISSTATITGGTIRTAATGERIVMTGTVMDLYSPNSTSNTARIRFNPPSNLYSGRIESTGSLTISTVVGNVIIGYQGVQLGSWFNLTSSAVHSFSGTISCIGQNINSGGNLSFNLQNGARVRMYGDTHSMGVQNATTYIRTSNTMAFYRGGSHSDVQYDPGSGGVMTMYLDYYGSIYVRDRAFKPNGGTWENSSDVRLKKNISDYFGGLALLKQLRPVSYEWDSSGMMFPKGTHIGLIAQEVEQVHPEWVGDFRQDVTRDSDGEVITDSKSLSYTSDFNAIVISAIKELAEIVESLKIQVDELKQV